MTKRIFIVVLLISISSLAAISIPKAITRLSGDVLSGGPGVSATTLTKIQGYTVDLSTAPTNNQVLQYSTGTNKWTAQTVSGGGGGGSVTDVTGTLPVYVTSVSTLTPNIKILLSSSTQDGYLSSTDWSTFNSKEPAIASGTTLQYYRGDKTFQTLNTDVVPAGSINKYLTFPLNAPNGTLSAPTLNFTDNDSGLWQNGDGNISFSANGFLRMEVNQNQVDVIGPLDVTGNISAANFPPTGTSNAFAGYDATGTLFSIPGWSFQTGSGALSAYVARDITLDSGFTAYNFEMAAEATASTLIGITGMNLDMHYDRNNTGADLQTLYGMNSSVRNEGSGFVNQVLGFNSYAQAGNGNGGGVNNLSAGNFNATLASGTSLTNSLQGIFVGIQANSQTVDNGYLINSNVNDTTFTNNFNGIISSTNNSTFNNAYAMFNGYANNSNTFNGNNWYGMVIGNDAQIAGFADGVRTSFNGNVTKNLNGFAISTNANTLTSPGFNMTGFDVNVNNTTFNGDNFTAFNGFIAGVGATQTNVAVLNFTNELSGTNRFSGIYLQNNESQLEEIRGFNFNSSGEARTQTGLDLVMSGKAIDDVQGVRINVSSMTSDSLSQHVVGLTVQGGITSIQSQYAPFSGYNVDIGNGMSVLSTVAAGTTLTGTDQILTLIQSNLQADGDIATGPFGLDTNMIGAVSQVAVGSGITVPNMRSLLVGTSVPSGSGGTITEHSVIEMLGLPSFGGAVTNPTRTGIKDSQILGQNFCDGATTCHFMKVNDPNALVTSNSGFQLSTSTTQPTCDVAHRGLIWNLEGGAGVADILQVCQKDASDNYVWNSY